MAITLSTVNFIEPDGELQEDLFPSGLEDLLDGWIAVATVKVEAAAGITNQNAAVEAWVYYRAYSHIAQRMGGDAAKASLSSGSSREFTPDQRAYFASRAAYWLAKYEALDTVVTEEEAAVAVPPSGSVRLRPTW